MRNLATDLPARTDPVKPAERIETIDSLRGLALFGVLAINLETEFRVSIFEDFVPDSPDRGLDRLVDAALTLFVDMKAFALFSLLFGAGLAIQHQRLENHPRRAMLLVRRLLALLAFGLIHLYLIWNGDILTDYAVGGLIILPFLYARTWLVTVACSALLALYVTMPLLPPAVVLPSLHWITGHIESAQRAYGSGSFRDVLRFRVREIPALVPLHVLIFPRTLGLFLLGVLVWRTRLIQHASRHTGWLWSAAVSGIGLGLILTLATSARWFSGWPRIGLIAAMLSPLATVVLALGYASLVTALNTLPSGRRALGLVAPMGRMAFTNYIVQSLVLGWIFYGYGLGLFGKIGPATGLGMATAI